MNELGAPWSDEPIFKNWDVVQAFLMRVRGDLNWMPLEEEKGKVLEEYGCGLYGCVMPTGDPDVVLKLTTDVNEAKFAHLASGMGENQPPGIVRYYEAVKVPGAKVSPPERDPGEGPYQIYLLWREGANKVGALGKYVEDRGGRISNSDPLYDFLQSITLIVQAGRFLHGNIGAMQKARPKISPPQWKKFYTVLFQLFEDEMARRPPRDLSLLAPTHGMEILRDAARLYPALMSAEPAFRYLGATLPAADTAGMSGLYWMLEEQIYIVDLHAGNFGEVLHPDDPASPDLIITDPGQTVLIGPKHYPLKEPPSITTKGKKRVRGKKGRGK